MLPTLIKTICAGIFAALLYFMISPLPAWEPGYGDTTQNPWHLKADFYALSWAFACFALLWIIFYFVFGLSKKLSFELENDAERAALKGLKRDINEMRQDPDIAPMAIARTLLEEAERIIQADTENSAARAELAPLNNRIRAALEPVRT